MPKQLTKLQSKQQLVIKSSQSGFTIIESLLAMMVITILMVGLAPIIALSVATRVQARRVELGAEAAKTYIDGVRSGIILDPEINTTALSDVGAPPAGNLTCDDNAECTAPANNLYCIDGDGDKICTSNSTTDMIVQGSGFSPVAITDADDGYSLGVRVYRADAFQEQALETSSDLDSNKALTFTGGLGKRKAPLVEITTEITTAKTNMNDFRRRFPNLPNTN
ncbi:MAG: type II secretion system protein [Symploca sp. SIO2B6]|nr:type II secretion system protein [Symploca sp. SIO2B6]